MAVTESLLLMISVQINPLFIKYQKVKKTKKKTKETSLLCLICPTISSETPHLS